MIIDILKFTLKTAIGIGIFTLVGGRIFYPEETNELIINPARKVPFMGSVIGTAWDGAGNIGPTITQKTVELADHVETTDLNIEETVLGVAESEDPKEEITKAIEEKVEQKIQQVKDLPETVIEEMKDQIRQEIYTQVCQDWQPEEDLSPPAEIEN